MVGDFIERIEMPRMEFYRHVYKDSVRWNGIDSLSGKTVIVYCEQGFGDIIQFARYFKYLKCRVILHCPIELHRLMLTLGVEVFDKNDDCLPPHDYHVLSMSLPFLVKTFKVDQPYIFSDTMILDDPSFKIGITWEGNPVHVDNLTRSCPLYHFKRLQKPDVKLFKIQKYMFLPELQCDIEMFGVPVEDFFDTAKVINAMDLIVTVDTSILHLAGALGKKTFGLLSYNSDYRWEVAKWYDSVTLIKQNRLNDWDSVFDKLETLL